MNRRERIHTEFFKVLESTGGDASSPPADDQRLLDSGLDSLGFAILVARLEDAFGFDPFIALDEAVYPMTFGEFIAIYEQHQSA